MARMGACTSAGRRFEAAARPAVERAAARSLLRLLGYKIALPIAGLGVVTLTVALLMLLIKRS